MTMRGPTTETGLPRILMTAHEARGFWEQWSLLQQLQDLHNETRQNPSAESFLDNDFSTHMTRLWRERR